ncbi:MAG TPA: universal stress protein [Actinomycetes bacterium]|nr:universal stress protein [Actinomycetes bacterium]
MIERVLLAVDDSSPSLAAARLAVGMARSWRLQLRAVSVSSNHALDAALAGAGGQADAAGARRAMSTGAVLARVTSLAHESGVNVETEMLAGDVGPAILAAARDWNADLIVMGKSARPARGEPYVGSQTRHVLEFADQPVLVVPPQGPR